MTIAAVVPAMHAVGALATLASSVVSAAPDRSGAPGSSNGTGLNQMELVLKRQ